MEEKLKCEWIDQKGDMVRLSRSQEGHAEKMAMSYLAVGPDRPGWREARTAAISLVACYCPDRDLMRRL